MKRSTSASSRSVTSCRQARKLGRSPVTSSRRLSSGRKRYRSNTRFAGRGGTKPVNAAVLSSAAVTFPSASTTLARAQHQVFARAVQQEVLGAVAELADAGDVSHDVEHVGQRDLAGRVAVGVLHVPADIDRRVRRSVRQRHREEVGERALDGGATTRALAP